MHRALGLFVALLPACGVVAGPRSWDARYAEAQKELAAATQPFERFYALNDATKSAFEIGRLEEAARLAEEMLRVAPDFRDDWNYGNAVHDAHMVLGRIALRNGRRELARQELLAAGATPGSPQLDSFGPNMSLARDLLQAGERDAVLKYFTLCERFWKFRDEHLPGWRAAIAAGQLPDFGANLRY